MDKININLIPVEVKAYDLRQKRFKTVQLVGITTVLILMFFSSLVFSLRILQSQNIQKSKQDITSLEGNLSLLVGKEKAILTLKDRIVNIQKVTVSPSRHRTLYELVGSLIPSNVTVNSLSVDKAGNMVISAVTGDSLQVDLLIDKLSSPVTNGDKISRVEIESLSRGKDSLYIVNLKAIPK